jgi:large subunit ribosomal protein L15
MPLHRRIPKRGFHNKWATSYLTVNLAQLSSVPAGTVVDYDYVVENSLAKVVKNNGGLKVLGGGEIKVALTIKAAKFTESAKAAIEAAGGTAEIVE